MSVFVDEEDRRTRKEPLRQGTKQQQTQSTYLSTGPELNRSHVGGRRAFSHYAFPAPSINDYLLFLVLSSDPEVHSYILFRPSVQSKSVLNAAPVKRVQKDPGWSPEVRVSLLVYSFVSSKVDRNLIELYKTNEKVPRN